MHPGFELANVQDFKPLIESELVSIVIPHTRGRMVRAQGPNRGDMPPEVVSVWHVLSAMNDQHNVTEARGSIMFQVRAGFGGLGRPPPRLFFFGGGVLFGEVACSLCGTLGAACALCGSSREMCCVPCEAWDDWHDTADLRPFAQELPELLACDECPPELFCIFCNMWIASG